MGERQIGEGLNLPVVPMRWKRRRELGEKASVEKKARAIAREEHLSLGQ